MTAARPYRAGGLSAAAAAGRWAWLPPLFRADRRGAWGGALAVLERPSAACRSSAPGGDLRLLTAGCRLLTGSLLAVAGAYAGLATLSAVDCGLDPGTPEAHVEEPEGALPPDLGPRAAGAEALVLPPGVAPEALAAAPAPAVRIELAVPCLLDAVRRERQRGLSAALLLPAGLLPKLLAAALAEQAPDVPLLTYVGLDHLRGQLGVLARLRPGLVLAEPAAAALARRAGLPASSIYEGAGRCLLVHPLERAIARAVLGRLRALSHEGGSAAPGDGAVTSRVRPHAGEVWRSLEPLREVVALRTARRFVLVPAASISYISSRGGLVTVHTDQGEFWSDRTLAEVERRLDPRAFFRLDASRLVNLCRAVELLPWTHQRYRLRLADAAGTELILSRDVGRRLRAALGW